jgi:uncharacterized protein
MSNAIAAPPYEITAGRRIDPTDFLSFVVERDMYQPDMASVVLSNQASNYSATEFGAPVEIKVGDEMTSIYKGEVAALEPTYRGGEKMRLNVRAMNKMHRLLRQRKSTTFTNKTDQQILTEVVSDGGLTLDWKHEKNITYKHVYQHNRTNMEFLRNRAARMGCHVWCVDTKLFCKEPDLQKSPKKELKIFQPGGTPGVSAITSFTPRINTSNILKKCTVKGWNPETKELITGEYTAQKSKLGKISAHEYSKDLGKEETFQVDQPIWSREEAMALAKAMLVDRSLTFMTGECEITGTPDIDIGDIVSVEANCEPDTKDSDPFNGNYYVMGITHRYILSKTRDGGYSTILRLARDAAQKP